MSAWTLHEREKELLAMFAARPAGTLAGYSTGFERLDKAIWGLRGLTLLGGYNHAGKSILAFGVALHVAEHEPKPTRALIVSGEMNHDATAAMIIGAAIGVEQQAVLAGRLGEADRERFEDYLGRVGKRVHVMSSADSLSGVAIEESLDGYRGGVVVIDSLHALARVWFPKLDEKKQLDRAMDRIHRWQQETRAAFIVIAQLPKQGTAGFNFSGSGGIDYATNASWLLERVDAAPSRARGPKGLAGKASHRLRIVKVRGGEGGVVDLVLDGKTTRFREVGAK